MSYFILSPDRAQTIIYLKWQSDDQPKNRQSVVAPVDHIVSCRQITGLEVSFDSLRCHDILSNRSRVAPNAQLSSTPSIFFRSYKRGTKKKLQKEKTTSQNESRWVGCILWEVRVKGKNFVVRSLSLLYAGYLDKTKKNKTTKKKKLVTQIRAEFLSDERR